MTAGAAARQALAVAERLLEPDTVLTAVATQEAAASLANGLAGTALLHARLATVDPVFSLAATRHWTAAARHAPARSAPGIFGTRGGMTASLILGTPYLPDPDRHRGAVARATRWLATEAHRAALGVRTCPGPLTWRSYDTISGLAGIGRILLAAHAAGHATAEPGLHATLTALTSMIHRSGPRPGWWIPDDSQPGTGRAATGLAHGIAGPLAFLTNAHVAGHAVERQQDAIRRAATWLLEWQANDTWPPAVTGSDVPGAVMTAAPGRRDAWCYGAPGIARALIRAGEALADPRLTSAGRRALDRQAARRPQQWDAEGPTLCHGYAGVLQSAGTGPLAQNAAEEIASLYNPQTAFGFRHHHLGSARDNPGFLTGAAGVALALADSGALPAPSTPTRWDAALLLS
jgi:hypothetical protein